MVVGSIPSCLLPCSSLMVIDERVIFRVSWGSLVRHTWMAASGTHERTSYLSSVIVCEATPQDWLQIKSNEPLGMFSNCNWNCRQNLSLYHLFYLHYQLFKWILAISSLRIDPHPSPLCRSISHSLAQEIKPSVGFLHWWWSAHSSSCR